MAALAPSRIATDDPLPAPVAVLANGTLYSLSVVGGLLGHRKRSDAWLCRYADALIAHDGFPAPLPLPTRDGTSRRAHRDSRWQAVAVDAWIAAQIPVQLVAAASASVLAAASSRLDARARGLVCIDGGRA